MTRKHTCIRRYAYNALKVFLLCVAVSTLSCSSTSSSLVYENPGLKYVRLRTIGHPGGLSKYHERLKRELPWIEFVNCHKMYFKDVNDLNSAVDAIARKRGVTTYYGKEDIKKQIKWRYPLLDQKTRYRLSFNYYGLSAFIDNQSFHRKDF